MRVPLLGFNSQRVPIDFIFFHKRLQLQREQIEVNTRTIQCIESMKFAFAQRGVLGDPDFLPDGDIEKVDLKFKVDN